LAPNKSLYFPSNLWLVRSFFIFPSSSRGGGASPRNYHTTQFLLCIVDPFHLIPHSYAIWWQYNPSLRIFGFICPCFFFHWAYMLQKSTSSGCKPLTIYHLFTYIPLRAQEKPKTNFNWTFTDQLSQSYINFLMLHKFNGSLDRTNLILIISFF
jgi:hypothetical protein